MSSGAELQGKSTREERRKNGYSGRRHLNRFVDKLWQVCLSIGVHVDSSCVCFQGFELVYFVGIVSLLTRCCNVRGNACVSVAMIASRYLSRVGKLRGTHNIDCSRDEALKLFLVE